MRIESTKEVPPGWYKYQRGVVMVYLPHPKAPPDPSYAGPDDRKLYPRMIVNGEYGGDPRKIGPYLRPISCEEYMRLRKLPPGRLDMKTEKPLF